MTVPDPGSSYVSTIGDALIRDVSVMGTSDILIMAYPIHDDMEPQPKQKASKHVCLTIRGPMGISEDPIFDIVSALADKDVLIMVRGLAHEEIRSPFTDGVFGMDESRTNAAIRKMKGAGLISSRRDGPDHVYFLNKGRYKELEHFLSGLFPE